MQFTSIVASLALALGAAAAPVADEVPFWSVQFQAWNWDCGASGAHTLGTYLTNTLDECQPLPADTRGLDVQVLRDGCRLTAYSNEDCSDEEFQVSWIERTACLWTDRPYKSYTLSCAE